MSNRRDLTGRRSRAQKAIAAILAIVVAGLAWAATRAWSPVVFLNAGLRTSPLLVTSRGTTFVLIATTDGGITAIDPASHEPAWTADIEAPPGLHPLLMATPAVAQNKLVVAYMTSNRAGKRVGHRVAVLDLETREFDERFPQLELSAEKPSADSSGIVRFNPPTTLSRAALAHAPKGTATSVMPVFRSVMPVTFNRGTGGSSRSTLTHGRAKGAGQAVSSVLLTTPEHRCGEPGVSGSGDMVCGGGVWAYAGPQVYPTGEAFELLVLTGNGQLDLQGGSYANSLMRVGPGLRL